MSEEERQPHTDKPAEGAGEDVESPGVDKPGDPANPATADGEQQRAAHAEEPAEGGEDQVDND